MILRKTGRIGLLFFTYASVVVLCPRIFILKVWPLKRVDEKHKVFSKSLLLGWTWIPKLVPLAPSICWNLCSALLTFQLLCSAGFLSSCASTLWWSAHSLRICAQIWRAPHSVSLFSVISFLNLQLLWLFTTLTSEPSVQSISLFLIEPILTYFTRWEGPSVGVSGPV